MTQAVVSDINETLQFIDTLLYNMDNKERKQTQVAAKKEKRRETEMLQKREQTLQRNINELIDFKSHIDMTLFYGKQLRMRWLNDFVINDIDEKELAFWIQHRNGDQNQISRFTTNEFLNYLQQMNGSTFSSSYLQQQLGITPSLMIKTMQMFHRRKYQMDDRENFKKLVHIESKWWLLQCKSACINAVEWIEKCIRYQISPLVLIKEFLKAKRLFLGYEASMEHTKRENEGISCKRNGKQHISKVQLRFMLDICLIPAMNLKWEQNQQLQSKQFQVYYQWICFATYVHKHKWSKYFSLTMSEKQPVKFKEFEADFTDYKATNEYLIPNVEGLLSVEMCTAISKIVLSEGTIRDNVKYYKDLTVRKPSSLFEKICVSKVRDVIKVYNQKYKKDVKALGERKIRDLNPNKKRKGRKKKKIKPFPIKVDHEVSPDLLLSESIRINGVDVLWIETKFYYLSPYDRLGVNMVLNSIMKYVKTYGSGAIICCGFNPNFTKVIRKALEENRLEQYYVVLLEASNWSESITNGAQCFYDLLD